ncbi:4-hydroxythreonine-4-phosphate dehydrogenase [Achromatium sp. WMS2]|nr:4-hydroxythreonine-4-phosphate dehydrogenase [Achromatium sp. WMS2]
MPKIAITPGEPAGIGIDLVTMLKTHMIKANFVIIADQRLLEQRSVQLKAPWNKDTNQVFYDINALKNLPMQPGVTILHVPIDTEVIPGQLNPKNAKYVLNTIDIACNGCMNKIFDAMVTGPVHKGIINQAGYQFTGHTEWLAARSHSKPVMMLVTPGLRVAMVTTHLPVAKISAAITKTHLKAVINILYNGLYTNFNISQPRIAVCGLNPHAGEDGHMGTEEQDVIIPVLEQLRAQGLNLIGPLSADSAFTPHNLQQFDVVLTMYHDQGLPVLKHIGFSNAANITLGLPFIRVSVDHGTAIHLAGTGLVNAGSLNYAIEIAMELISKTACHKQ